MTNKVYYNYDQIEAGVLIIGREILLSDWRPDYIVGIARGGCLPAILLGNFLNVPTKVLTVSLRDNPDFTVEDCIAADDAAGNWIYEGDHDYTGERQAGKNILVVDDINDTGATFEFIKESWGYADVDWDEIWHKSVRFAVIIENLSSDFSSDYHSTEINKAEDPCWIVFPWEDWWPDHA